MLLVSVGCAAGPSEVSIPVTPREAEADLNRMKAEPMRLERPVVVLGGYADIGFNRRRLDVRLRSIFAADREQIVGVAFAFVISFDDCRAKALHAVEAAFPSDDPAWTTEVDVIGYSMGGLIARYAALPLTEEEQQAEAPRKRLRMARLFTIATPHRGADMAAVPHFDGTVQDMRAGSAFLVQLDRALPGARYELFPYVRLSDRIVGPENAAPPGWTAWWVPHQPFTGAHLHAHRDPRIVADIVRRLRGEEPLAVDPPPSIPR